MIPELRKSTGKAFWLHAKSVGQQILFEWKLNFGWTGITIWCETEDELSNSLRRRANRYLFDLLYKRF